MKINNKLVSALFNFFDFPIRFTYCRLGFLSRLLNKFMFWKIYTSDFEKLNKKTETLEKEILKYNFSFEDKVIIELGPGNSYINAYNMLMKGAKKIILIDKYPRVLNNKKQFDFFKAELNFIKNKYRVDKLFFVKDDESGVKEEYIQEIASDIQDITLPGVDLIYSYSVFEHINALDIEGTINKLYQVLNEQGYMYHFIDMRDHYNFTRPFLFYKYSDNIWNSFLTKEGLSYTNRIRYPEFMNCFLKTGFSVVAEDKTEYKMDEKRVAQRFKEIDKLNVGTVGILLKKSSVK